MSDLAAGRPDPAGVAPPSTLPPRPQDFWAVSCPSLPLAHMPIGRCSHSLATSTDVGPCCRSLPPHHRHRLRCARADPVSFVEIWLDSSVLALVAASAGYRQVFAHLANKANAALYVSLLDPTGIKSLASVTTTRSTAVWPAAICWTLPTVSSAQCVVSSSAVRAPSGQTAMREKALHAFHVSERMFFMKRSS